MAARRVVTSRTPLFYPNGASSQGLFCFVCNNPIGDGASKEETLKEWSQIQDVFMKVFDIHSKRGLEPFKANSFCQTCERKARGVQRLAKELEALQTALDKVRNEIAYAIVSTYVYTSTDHPNFQMKHLIYEKWFNRVQDLAELEPPFNSKSDKIEEATNTAPKIPDEAAPASAVHAKPKKVGSEREVAELIKLTEEHMTFDQHNSNVEEAICIICSKICRNKDLLEVHLKTHESDDKPFVCRVCGKSFFGKAVLKKHLQIKHADCKQSENLCKDEAKTEYQLSGADGYGRAKVKLPKLQCEMCGKSYTQRKMLQKHIKKIHRQRRTHTKTKEKPSTICDFCGSSCGGACLDSNSLASADAHNVKPVGENAPCSVEQPSSPEYFEDSDKEAPHSAEISLSTFDEDEHRSELTDGELIARFKKLNPTYRDIQFRVVLKCHRITGSKEKPTVVEEEKRPPHILKSVAWKAKGAWFTQEKKLPTQSSSTTTNLQENWKSFFQKSQKPKGPDVQIIGSRRVFSTSRPLAMSMDSESSAIPNFIAVSNLVDTPSAPFNILEMPGVKLESQDECEDVTRASSPTLNLHSDIAPMLPTSDTIDNPVTATPIVDRIRAASPNRPVNSSYWVDPKSVIESTPSNTIPSTDLTLQPLLNKVPADKTIHMKAGPMSKKNLFDITRGLKMGVKKPSEKQKCVQGPPVVRPSSIQITKVARQLRKIGGLGVGVSAAKQRRFEPVFQLHPLGASTQTAKAVVPPTLTLNKSVTGSGNKSTDKCSSNSNAAVVHNLPKRKFHMIDKVKACPKVATTHSERRTLRESAMTGEMETNVQDLMRNPNVTVLPSSAVRTPAAEVPDFKRSLKRMAGPKSKTRVCIETPSKCPSVPTIPMNSAGSSFRFVNVQDVLSKNTIPTSENAVPVNPSPATSHLMQRRESLSTSFSSPSPNNCIPSKHKSALNMNSEIPIHEILSDSDNEDEPKIRIRNLQSLAEPEPGEEDEDSCEYDDYDDQDEDDVMEMEDTETYAPTFGVGSNTNVVPFQLATAGSSNVVLGTSYSLASPANNSRGLLTENPPHMVIDNPQFLIRQSFIQSSVPVLTRSPSPETFVYSVTETEGAIEVVPQGNSFSPVITNVFSQLAPILPFSKTPLASRTYPAPASRTSVVTNSHSHTDPVPIDDISIDSLLRI